MKLEEVLAAYREGKTIISSNNTKYNIVGEKKGSLLRCIGYESEVLGEWKIEKDKVKKYPVLYLNEKGYWISQVRYKCLDEAQEHYSSKAIRFITEIPELIEEVEL